MSRIGKKIINLPEKVEAKLQQDTLVVKGPKGELSQKIDDRLEVELGDKNILIRPRTGDTDLSARWGLCRALVSNMVKGVSEGFEKNLIFQGVGFRASVSGQNLELSLGFSHPIKVEAPLGVSFKVEKNKISILGINKDEIGKVAALIRSKRKPEPYKGRGIRYEDEVIIKKAGKKAAVAG